MMKAVLYCRVSSEEQRERASIRTQFEFAREHCRLHDIEILETYKDDGISGTIKVAERPEGARMLTDAKAGKFDRLLVYRLDRLARRTSDILNTVEFLKERSIAVQSLTEPFESGTATGKFLVSMLASVAELERDAIADRTRAGMERIARDGRWLGGRAPFGYNVVNGRLAVEPVQARIVKDIFSWYLSGQRVRGITTRLNALGVRHPMEWTKPGKNRPWYEATVSHLLNNRIYMGEWTWRKRTDRRMVQGRATCTKTTPQQQISVVVPAIVSRDDFDLVRETLRSNFNNSLRNGKHFYLVRALLTCGECGRRYIGLASGRKPWVKNYYRCSSHVGAACRVPCRGKALRADLIDQAVWSQCAAFINNPSDVLNEMRSTMETRQYSQLDMKSEVRQMDSAIGVKAKERAKVINLSRRELISDDEAEQELVLLRGEIAQLEQQRAELLSRLEAGEDSELKLLTAEAVLNVMAERVANADNTMKREIVCALVSRIVIQTIGEGKEARPLATVSYVFRPSLEAVNSVEPALATSSARFAAC